MKAKINKSILAFVFGLIPLIGLSLQRVEINNQTINIKDSLRQPNRFFIITEDIILTEDITLGVNSVLSFEGGSFVSEKPLEITLNNVEILAPSYQIFGDNIEFVGKIKNPIVAAEWFGTAGEDASKMINRALDFSGGNKIVSLESSEYYIQSPILLNQRGQRLWCSGTIINQSDSAAINVGANNLDVRIRSLEGYPDLGVNPFDSFRGSGILFGGNCFNSRFEIDRIYGFERGIDISPYCLFNNGQDSTETLITSGVQYTEIKFKKITAKTGIYINIYGDLYTSPQPLSKRYSTWCNENQFNGGIITAKQGIDIVEKKGQNAPEYEINGNVFSNIDFENVTELPIRMNNECHDYYTNINFKGSSLKCSSLVDVRDSKFCRLNLKGEYSGEKIKSGEDCYGIIIDGAFYLDFLKDRVHFLDRMAIFSNQNWGKGPSTKYLTSSISGIGMVNTIELPKPSGQAVKDTILTLSDLLSPYSIFTKSATEKDRGDKDFELNPDMPAIPWPGFEDTGVKFLNQSCLLKIGDNNNVYLNLYGRAYVNYPIYLKLEVSDHSTVRAKNGQSITNLKSGNYLLTFSTKGESELQSL